MARSITNRVVRNARSRGLKVYTRRECAVISPVYAFRRKTKPHGLLPGHAVDTVWQHISVTRVEPIKAAMRLLHRIGMDRFRSGISYNFGVHPITGEIGVGMPLDAKGTHTINWKRIPNFSFDQNAVSIAICFIGMPGVIPSEKAKNAVSVLLAALMEEGAVRSGFDYVPHSLVAAKDCPTDAIRDAMPEIRRGIPPIKRR